MQQPVPLDPIYQSYDKNLYRITGDEQENEILNMLNADPGANNGTTGSISVAADSIDSGASSGTVVQASGAATATGKKTFDNTVAGYILGFDPKDGYAKFFIGNTTQYLNWDGQTLTITGAAIIGSLNVPDTTTANSFHVDANGNTWWGANVATGFAGAPARVLNTGAATFSSITITGGSVVTSVLNIGVMGWTTDIVFSSTSASQINWSSGHVVMQNGTTYNISAGNTGAMAALTYIYLDIGTSTTVLQITTTYSTATGDGKVLIATAQNNTVGASVIPQNGSQAILDGTSQIAALSITAAAIAASTITAAKMSVSQLSAIAANIGTITAGTLTLDTSGYVRGGATDYLTGTGIFLGYSGAAYKFSVGNPAGNYIGWDGATLTIIGNQVDVQTFDSSGTWTKPTGAKSVVVQAWGGGGGGGDARGGGGGGGAYAEFAFNATDLTSTVSVTIPTAAASNNAGGNVTFGAYLTAYGGGAGGNNNLSCGGGGGGGGLGGGSNGGSGGSGTGGVGGEPAGGVAGGGRNAGFGGGGGGTSAGTTSGGNSAYGGGGGGSNGDSGGATMYGGGGGGGGGAGTPGTAGGTSVFGGAGGASVTGGDGLPGVAPGGGGGGAGTGKFGGAGAKGRIKITSYL